MPDRPVLAVRSVCIAQQSELKSMMQNKPEQALELWGAIAQQQAKQQMIRVVKDDAELVAANEGRTGIFC